MVAYEPPSCSGKIDMEQADKKPELRILMLEDVAADAELAEYELHKSGMIFISARADGRQSFLSLLDEFHPDVILADYKLPDFDGLSALKIVQHDHPEIPVIMLTGALTDIDAVALIHAGAKDYVLKDRLARLAPAIQHALSMKHEEHARKEAERGRHISEVRFHELAAQSPMGISIISEEGYVYINSRYANMFGYTTEEVMKLKPLDVIEKGSRPLTQEMIRKRLTGEIQKADFEVKGVRRDGTLIDLEIHGSGIVLDGVHLVISSLLDITERKRAESALHDSEEKFHELAKHSPLGISIIGPNGYIYINPRYAEIFGYTEEEIIKLTPLDVVMKDDHPIMKNMMCEPSSDDLQRAYYEVRGIRKDGAIINLEIHRSRMVLGGATVTISSALDITERKRSELALVRANRNLLVLGSCNEALVHATSEAQLLVSICQLIVQTGGYCMAWVGFAEQDLEKTVSPAAHFGTEAGYLSEMKFHWADDELGRGPTGTAIRTGVVQICNNYPSNPAVAPWREAALKRGYHSSIALPLESSTGILGSLTIYAQEHDAFSQEDVPLLQELANDISFGIVSLRTRVERDRSVQDRLGHEETLRKSLEDSIKAFSDTVEMRDPYTSGHQSRVAQLAVAIATEMKLPEETIRGIGLAAIVHDFGKISIPAEILSKPGKLTELEMMLVKNHPQAGYDILKDIKFPWPLAQMVLQHHEKLDGSGYPQGLKGDHILLESRILTVADVVESMALRRPYRDALGIDVALKEIENGRGTIYDASVVDACLKLFREGTFSLS